jgi:Ca2+-binding RTX toxin-like protein
MATIYGSRDNNTLNGTGSADAIYGLEGNDTLKRGGGADYLDESRDKPAPSKSLSIWRSSVEGGSRELIGSSAHRLV